MVLLARSSSRYQLTRTSSHCLMFEARDVHLPLPRGADSMRENLCQKKSRPDYSFV
jgi:hypothetical protein